MSNFNPLLTMEACVYVKSSIPSMSKWKDVCLVLMPDSTLGWYKINRKLIGSVKLSSVCKYLCVGHMAKAVSKTPKLPRDADLNQLLGVPMLCEPAPDKMHWFCFDHVKHLIKFLQALDTVLKPTKLADRPSSAAAPRLEPSAPPPPSYDEVTNKESDQDEQQQESGGCNSNNSNNNDDRRKALLTAGGLLATGLLLGPDSGWSWGYGWGASGASISGPLFQDIDERELLGYCLPARGLRGIPGPTGCGARGSVNRRYNRAYQRFNSDLGNDLDRYEEDLDRRAARRRSDAAADEARVATAEELGASLAVVSAAAAAAAGADRFVDSLQQENFFDEVNVGYDGNNVDEQLGEAAAAAFANEDQCVERGFASASRTSGGCPCPEDTDLTSLDDDANAVDAAAAADEATAAAAATAAISDDDDEALTMAAGPLGGQDDDLRRDDFCQEFDDCHLADALECDDNFDQRHGRDDEDDLQLMYSEHLDSSDGHCQGECGGDAYDCRDAADEYLDDLLRDEEDADEQQQEEADYYDRFDGDDGFGGFADDFGRDDDF